MEINGFILENQDKINRVIQGHLGRSGEMEGGLGESASPETILAHYDKMAGHITKDGIKIKTGSFWDFKGKKPHKEPQVKYLFNVSGDILEVNDPSELAQALQVLNGAKAKKEVEKAEVKAAKVKKAAKPKEVTEE